MEKDISCKCDKKVVVPILVSDKVDFKTKCIIRNKERHSINKPVSLRVARVGYYSQPKKHNRYNKETIVQL